MGLEKGKVDGLGDLGLAGLGLAWVRVGMVA